MLIIYLLAEDLGFPSWIILAKSIVLSCGNSGERQSSLTIDFTKGVTLDATHDSLGFTTTLGLGFGSIFSSCFNLDDTWIFFPSLCELPISFLDLEDGLFTKSPGEISTWLWSNTDAFNFGLKWFFFKIGLGGLSSSEELHFGVSLFWMFTSPQSSIGSCTITAK